VRGWGAEGLEGAAARGIGAWEGAGGGGKGVAEGGADKDGKAGVPRCCRRRSPTGAGEHVAEHGRFPWGRNEAEGLGVAFQASFSRRW